MSVMETDKSVAVFYMSTPLYSVKCLGYLSIRFSSEIFQCFEIVLVYYTKTCSFTLCIVCVRTLHTHIMAINVILI